MNSFEMIKKLIESGMNVARLNFSHGTQEGHAEIIAMINEARQILGVPVAIMLDTKGPEVRLGVIQEGGITLPKKHRWHLVRDVVEGDLEQVTINPGEIIDNLEVGTTVLFDDGYISSTVVELTERGVIVELQDQGKLTSRKGVNIPNVELNLPNLTETDREDIRFGCQHEVEMIAASFVRNANHLLEIQNLLEDEKQPNTLVLAKIENHEGVQNFDSILQIADGVMVARGDLGVEIPLKQVPKLQKEMINKCCLVGKPSVIATQMLESMMQSPRPTRAEVSDIANGIYDSASAVMLSGETAVGKYPIEALEMMRGIVEESENDFDYHTYFEMHSSRVYNDVTSSITLATVKTAYTSNAKAIFTFTSKGDTARLIARLRPKMPIVAMTPSLKTYHLMGFYWGVTPLLSDEFHDFEEAFSHICCYAKQVGIVNDGDLVVVTGGTPFGVSGTTNMMLVENIGNVLVRGFAGWGLPAYGNVTLVVSPNQRQPYEVRNQFLVLLHCTKEYLPLLQECSGIILQNSIDDQESEHCAIEAAKELSIPIIIRADMAFDVLKEGQLVTLDPEKALIYKGVVL